MRLQKADKTRDCEERVAKRVKRGAAPSTTKSTAETAVACGASALVNGLFRADGDVPSPGGHSGGGAKGSDSGDDADGTPSEAAERAALETVLSDFVPGDVELLDRICPTRATGDFRPHANWSDLVSYFRRQDFWK